MAFNHRLGLTRLGRSAISYGMGRVAKRLPKSFRSRSRRPVSGVGRSRRLATIRRTAVRSSASRLSSAGIGHNATVRRGKNRIKLRGRKKIKVSPKLRASIKQVTEGNKVRGYYQDNRIDIIEPGQLGGQQDVEQFPTRGTGRAGYLFHWDRVLHAASRLWNLKGAVLDPNVTDVNNFNADSTVVEVVKQWWTFRMRNNSSRRAMYRIYKCQKRNSSLANNAITAWSAGLTQMNADGQLITTPNFNQMHTGPTLSNQFRTAWKAEETKITLDPGEYYEFSVSGPSMTYRGQDFFNGSTYNNVQKQDIQIIVACNVDMVGTHSGGVAGNAGYAPDSVVAEPAQERTYIEGTYHAHLAMPEKVGGVTTTVGTLFQNSNRIRRTCIDDFQPQTFGTNIHRRDEENPVIETV